MNRLYYDEPQFLEPAHSHDPSQVSHLAAIPSRLLQNLSSEAQTTLRTIQESTSVAFASHKRLQALVQERFHRLVPAKDQDPGINTVKYSEPAFFNYTNHIRAEKEYLLEEAMPDWRHKAARVDFDGQHHLPLTINGKKTTVLKWWAGLQNEVEKWMEGAEDTEIPDFEETVAEYRLFQAKELRKDDARNERNRRRKTMLDLERPDFGDLKLEKMDSGVIV